MVLNMKKTKVCVFTSSHTYNDIRIYHKEVTSLVEAGYDVTLIALDDSKCKGIESVKLVLLPERDGRMQRLFFNVAALFFLTIKTNAKIYHFHDPELMFVGVFLRLIGKKVIYDAHEDLVNNLKSKKWIGNLLFRSLFATMYGILEKGCCLFFHNIITVTDGIGLRYSPKKVVILRNFPILKLVGNEIEDIDVKKKKPIIIYAGCLDKIRGINNIIEATGLLKGKVELWLMGIWASESLREECEALDGWQYTKSFGQVSINQVYKNMQIADIGIVTFLPAPLHLNCLPNKPFEYMASALPVVMSNFSDWQALFADNVVYCDPEDPEDIAIKIDELVSSPEDMKKYGERGNRLVLEEFSWEREKDRLIDLYQALN